MYFDIIYRVFYMYMIILLINFLVLIFWFVFILWLVWCGWGENEIYVMGNFFVDIYCSIYFVGDCIRLLVSVIFFEIIFLGVWIGICLYFCGIFEWCLYVYWF